MISVGKNQESFKNIRATNWSKFYKVLQDPGLIYLILIKRM